MAPKLDGIDHIHVYVGKWQDAEPWYEKIFGFVRVDALMPWAVDGGPLMLENPEGNVHLALFERPEHPGSSAIAFASTGKQFLEWKAHLEGHGLIPKVTDHTLAYSLYFHDPDRNLHEITTYEHDFVREQIGKDSFA